MLRVVDYGVCRGEITQGLENYTDNSPSRKGIDFMVRGREIIQNVRGDGDPVNMWKD